MEFLPTAVRPGGKRCLVLGLGAGIVPQWYERSGITTDVVEIDPNVVDLARVHFGYQGRGDLFLEDARYHLRTSTRTYDYLILDVYNGDSTPTHLIGVEAFSLARERLAPGGVLAINLHGSLGPRGTMTKAVAKTLGAVFDNVEIYPTYDPAKAEHGNIALIAYDGAPVELSPRSADGLFVHPVAREAVAKFHERRHMAPIPADVPLLTDDFNPMDIEDGWMREDIRRSILESSQWDLLLS
jgi:spermidine synthase